MAGPGVRFACRSSLALLCVVVLASLLWCAPALGLSQRGHVFSFSYGSKGKGEDQFSGPSGIAVSDATGDVYVADRKNKRVVQLEPVLNGTGELVDERYVRSFEAPSPSSVAVDNSTEVSDPSKGDVYVVGDGDRAIYKFSAEGVPIIALKSFETRAEREETEAAGKKEKKLQEKESKLGGVVGVAVDSGGSLFVHEEDGAIDEFSDAVSNEGESSVPGGLGVQGEPGLAVDSEDDVFVGVLGAGGFPVVSKLEGITGKVLVGSLDGEETTAVAVNTADVPANAVDELNDVYVTNVSEVAGVQRTTVAQFAPEAGGGPGALLQRFPSAGEEGAHGSAVVQRGTGIAVDDQTGTVYVSDSAADRVDVFELQPHGSPTIEGSSAQSVAATMGVTERLSARVDPDGADTHSYFEYGTGSCTAMPSSCTKSTPADLGEGFGDREVSLELGDLKPGVYHYRVVAENSFAEGSGAVHGPEHTFTIVASSSGLADGRAWEMVSPPNKHGASIEALTREGGLILAGEDGDALTYVTSGAISEEAQANRSPEMQQVLATRGASGWGSQDIVTPQTAALGTVAGHTPEYRFFSRDLSLALVEPFGTEPPLAPGVTQQKLYLRDDQPIQPGTAERDSYEAAQVDSSFQAPGYLPLLSKASAPEAISYGTTEFLGATPDLGNAVLVSTVALTGSSSGPGLYEWSHGGLRFVSELEDGTLAPAAALGYQHDQAHAISSDGTRVIWTESKENPAHLYMRDFATTPARTIQLDKAQEGITEPPGKAVFQTASTDGSRVFFTDDEPLTKDSSAEPEDPPRADLYECEMVEKGGKLGCNLHDLTVPLGAGEHTAVQGSVLGVSEDGSSVYLVAHGVLASNEDAGGERAVAGADNLYELHEDGGKWTTTLIAVLSGEDSPDWDQPELRSGETSTVIPGDPAFLTARVSANGEYVAFMSQRSLTGYDNEDVSSESEGERLDEEVYLYDARTASVTCVSCDPTGARPVGVLDEQNAGEGLGLLVDRRDVWADFKHPSEGHWLAGSIPGWTAQSLNSAIYQSRYLSNEGRLLFDGADALVPGIAEADRTREEEVAGRTQRVGVENVYEYEPAGVGSCQSATGGCVALISSGTSDRESAFLEATPSGNDAFFLTDAQLSSQDTDQSFDIYDARVCTPESPCVTPPAPSPAGCDEADLCRPASQSVQAPIGASGSATFSGAGNLALPSSSPKQEVKSVKAGAKPKPLTRAQKLADALKACKKRYPHSERKRQTCEAKARKLYAPIKKKAVKK